MTEVAEADGAKTCYAYDGEGNLTEVADAQGNETRYEYDAMGHLTKIDRVGNIENTDEEKPEHQVTAYQWNQSGHLERKRGCHGRGRETVLLSPG